MQEARLKVAAAELNSAQEKLDEKQRELDKVQAMYDGAVKEKQVTGRSRRVNWLSNYEGKAKQSDAKRMIHVIKTWRLFSI